MIIAQRSPKYVDESEVALKPPVHATRNSLLTATSNIVTRSTKRLNSKDSPKTSPTTPGTGLRRKQFRNGIINSLSNDCDKNSYGKMKFLYLI